MLPVQPKTLLRDVLFGFGIGLVVMLAIGYGSGYAGSPPAAATSTR